MFGDLRGRRVLLVGAGRIGELAAANLSARGAAIAYVANRAPGRGERARAAASAPSRSGSTTIPAALGEVDVVLTSTSAPGLVIEPRRRARAAGAGRCSSSTSPSRATSIRRVHELDGCFLYDIDDLEAVVAETLAGRRREAERAEQLVVEEAERFREWQASLDVVPAITSLRRTRRGDPGRRAGQAAAAAGRRRVRRSRPSRRRCSTSCSTSRPCG